MLNKGPKDIDERLKWVKDRKATLAKMKAGAREVASTKESLPRGQAKPPAKGAPSEPSTIDSWPFKSVIPVGELCDGQLLLFSRCNAHFYQVKSNDLKYPFMLQVGGEEIASRVYRRTEHRTPKRNLAFDAVRDRLVLDCRKTQMGSAKWHGQGIHRLSDRRVLILSGGMALIYDGQKLCPYAEPLIDGKLVEYDGGRGWIRMDELAGKLRDMDVDGAKKVVQRLLECFGQWGFVGGEDALTQFIAAFLALVVHNHFSFKAHIYVSGRAGTGKTLLLTMIQRLLGSGIARRREGSILTSAGLVQEAGHDAAYFLIDEFERSRSRDDILMVARSTGRGGTVGAKGTAIQKAVIVDINCAMCLCSIDRNLDEEAEQDRYVTFDLLKDASRKPDIPEEHELEGFREDLFAFCLWASFRAERMIQAVGLIEGFYGRAVEAYAPGLAMLTVGLGRDSDFFQSMLVGVLNQRRTGSGVVIADEMRLLNDILSLRLRIALEEASGDDSKTKYAQRTIGQLLTSREDLHLQEIEAHGVKLCPDGVFIVPEMLRNQLRNTEWENRGLKIYLKRLPGAAEKQRRCGGGNGKEGVLLPLSLVMGNEE